MSTYTRVYMYTHTRAQFYRIRIRTQSGCNLRSYSLRYYQLTLRANFNYLQDYYRRNKDAHYIDKRQARANNAVAEKFYGQVIAVDVRVRGGEVRIRFPFDMRHFYGPIYEPYTSQSPK